MASRSASLASLDQRRRPDDTGHMSGMSTFQEANTALLSPHGASYLRRHARPRSRRIGGRDERAAVDAALRRYLSIGGFPEAQAIAEKTLHNLLSHLEDAFMARLVSMHTASEPNARMHRTCATAAIGRCLPEREGARCGWWRVVTRAPTPCARTADPGPYAPGSRASTCDRS